MKTSNKLLLIAFGLIIVGIVALMIFVKVNIVQPELLEPSGNITEETRQTAFFDRIEAHSGITIVVSQDSPREIKVVADEKFIQKIKTEVVDGSTLKIYTDNRIKNPGQQKVFVTMDEIKEIDISRGVDITSEDTLITDALEVEASTGSRADLRVKAQEFTSNVSTGAKLHVAGYARNASITVSTGSDLNAESLTGQEMHTSVSTGSRAKVGIFDQLDISASTGGVVKYNKESNIRDIDVNNGGRIKRY